MLTAHNTIVADFAFYSISRKKTMVSWTVKIVIRSHNYLYLIIIMSCRQHGYPWPSFTAPPYCSSLLAGSQGYIPHPHRAAVCWFELVTLLLFGHVGGSIGEHHLWARPSCLVRLTLIVFVMGGRWPYSFVGCCLQDLFKIARNIIV